MNSPCIILVSLDVCLVALISSVLQIDFNVLKSVTYTEILILKVVNKTLIPV